MSQEIALPDIYADKAFKARRVQNWVLVGFLYSFFYMSRYNFSAVAPTLKGVFGWGQEDIGIFETLLPLVYGLSVVINAPLADKFGGRKAFLFGSIGVVIMNILFGLFSMAVVTQAVMGTGPDGKPLVITPAVFNYGFTAHGIAWIMAIIWAVNGYFQSFGALSIVKINAQWFHLRERGTFGAIFGVLIRLGLILAFSGVPLLITVLPWQWAFYVPAIFVLILFFLNLFFVKETPQEAGFGDLDTGDDDNGNGGEPVSVIMVIRKVFTSKVMWLIAIASMMIGFVRRSVVDSWWPIYFKEVLGLHNTDLLFQLAAWGIALLGIAGGFAFGITSDRVYEGRRAPVVVIGFVGMAAMLLLFYLLGIYGAGAWGAVISIALLSFFVSGAHGMIGGAASMDFGGKKAAATAAGLFDGMQYLAGAFTGYAVGEITTHYGWDTWKLWPIPFALVGAIVMAFLWNTRPGRSSH
jgi:MFS transporter, OPA family, glycerol-3-phosphate transporter